MTIDAEYVYGSLLGYNYFPMVKEHRDEIPPVFSTESFDSEIVGDLLATIPKRKYFDQIEYRTTRHSNITRMMHIPHPLPYAKLCKCIFDNWSHIEHICDSKHSRILPQKKAGDSSDERVIIYDYDGDSIGEGEEFTTDRILVMGRESFTKDISEHFKFSCGARFLVDADIASCFNTIYTHAIAWALVGHETAKANIGQTEIWYNKLDRHQRNLKRGETQGIPIGPGTSNIISEVILQKVDKVLAEIGYKFTRYIDDYKCFCDNHDTAEKFIRDLEFELAKYLLTLNIKKVAIKELPIPYKDSWVIDLNTHFPHGGEISAQKVVNYLDYALELQKNHLDGSVIKYALRSLTSKVNDANINEFLNYALNLSYHYPIILPVICDVIKQNKITMKKKVFKELVLANFRQHLKYKRSDAVCWCLYCTGLVGFSMLEEIASEIIESLDCMSIAMLLSFSEHESLVLEFVNSLEDRPDYDKDQYWILIHQLGSQLTTKKLLQYYNKTGLELLADKGVYFINKICPSDEF